MNRQKKNLTIEIPNLNLNPQLYNLHEHRLRPIPDSWEGDNIDEQQAKFARFITVNNKVTRYIELLNYVFETNQKFLDVVQEYEKLLFLNKIIEFCKLVEEHLCEKKLISFMMQKEGLLLANLFTFMESDANEKMQLILEKVNQFQINHCWIHKYMPDEPPWVHEDLI
jgi:hypothetical protein